jgi:hypothetical protein
MASIRPPRRNPFRPGTASHARFREVRLKKQANLARAHAARATTPKTRRRAKQRVSAAQRALRVLETRQEFRSRLLEPERTVFNGLSLSGQDRLLRGSQDFPEGVPSDLPDPFAGPKRSETWRLYYATRAGIRQRALA